MATQRVVYLAVEGLLFPLVANLKSPKSVGVSTDSHMRRLGTMFEAFVNVGVVLNSCWVAKHGYRTVLDSLPRELRSKVVGATIPGNKLLGPSAATLNLSRRCLLDQDYFRRQPNEAIVLDTDVRVVPIPLRHRAFIVEGGLWRARESAWARLEEAFKTLT